MQGWWVTGGLEEVQRQGREGGCRGEGVDRGGAKGREGVVVSESARSVTGQRGSDAATWRWRVAPLLWVAW